MVRVEEVRVPAQGTGRVAASVGAGSVHHRGRRTRAAYMETLTRAAYMETLTKQMNDYSQRNLP
jgi:hypothetical protein